MPSSKLNRFANFNDPSQRQTPAVDQLSIEILRHLELIDKSTHLKAFRRGSNIPLNPNQVWVVHQGVVQLGTLYPSGDESIIGFAVPGMPFGLPMTQVDPYSAIALSDTLLYRFSMDQINQSSLLTEMIGQQAQHRLRQTEALLAMLAYRRVEDRLRQFLILLGGEVGESITTPTMTGIRITVRMTHQLIANATGTTRVTITRLLGQLQRTGWLQFDSQNHIVLTRHTSGFLSN
jgi:CRP-like cAMP-binding protein